MSDIYHVTVLPEAAAELSALDKPAGRRIVGRLNWMAANLPHIRLQELKGDLAEFYKLRVGDYRVIFQVLKEEQTIIVHAIGHRKDIYRKKY